jgi:Reverse transcriptase (RNA-dependent DNA polymerase)
LIALNQIRSQRLLSLKNLLLKQALYGLSQSGFEWAAMLCTALEAIGFHSIANDNNLYINNSSNNFNKRAATIFIALYIDDLVITFKDQLTIDITIHNLNKIFNIHSLGPILQFLSLNITDEGLYNKIHIF